MKSKKIKLISKDGFEKIVEKDILNKSTVLRDLIEEFQSFDPEDDEIPLNEISGKNLDLIIKYLEHYRNMEPKMIPKPFPSRVNWQFLRKILNDQWTFNYVQSLQLDECIDLINDADYLQIIGLTTILCAKLSYEMCNCSTEEARKKFQIEEDMSEEEKNEYDKLYRKMKII